DIGTVELKSETWRVTTRELRGPVKEVAKVAAAAGGTLIAPALGVTGMDMEVVVSSKKEDRTEISQEVGSMLQGHNVSLSARDEVKLTGSTVMADEVQGS